MQVTRIVQITDLHVLSDNNAEICGVKPNQSLARVIGSINELSPPADLVVASGDLTDDGSREAYRRLRQLLLRLQCPVYVMAGNHDAVAEMRQELPGDNIFYHRQVEKNNWKLLLVDSKKPESSFGFISDNEISWLQAQLSSEAHRPVLLAMHHTPLNLCASPACRVKNADSFLSMLGRFKQVKALVAGHTHNVAEAFSNHISIMTTPSTMVQVTHNEHEAFESNDQFWAYHTPDVSRHGYRIIDLRPDGTYASEVCWIKAE